MATSYRSALTHLRGIALTAPFVTYLFAADIALSLLLPLKPIFPRLVYDVSSSIASSAWSFIQTIFVRCNGACITISGDNLPEEESAVVVCNHVAWSDFYMIQALALRKGMLGRCRYFAKKQLRMVPFLGWGLWAMGMPMVSRNWVKDRSELDRVFAKTIKGGFPTWLVNFSEATRFTPQKYAESQLWCKEASRPQPMHLLYPRTRGFITTVQQLRKAPHVTAVYDFTIAYQGPGREWQSPPSMWDTLSVPGLSGEVGYSFSVNVRRFEMNDLPTEDSELAKWLETRWIEKGEWLESQRLSWAEEAVS